MGETGSVTVTVSDLLLKLFLMSPVTQNAQSSWSFFSSDQEAGNYLTVAVSSAGIHILLIAYFCLMHPLISAGKPLVCDLRSSLLP